MPDVVGINVQDALAHLPQEERMYSGSNAQVLLWPYEA